MKKLIIYKYLLGVILGVLSNTGIIFISHGSRYSIIGFIMIITLINLSSIYFYKSLNIKKEYLKIIFSTINLIIYIIIGFLSIGNFLMNNK